MIDLFEGENVVLKLHRHWYGFISQVIGLFFLAAIFFVAWAYADKIFPDLASALGEDKFFGAGAFFATAWLLILWMAFAIIFTDYYLDVLVVTNKRLIDIDQITLFSRDIATIPIESIQDIKVEILGVIPTLLKFGTLHIQTAGVMKEIQIPEIANPEEVKNQILKIHEQYLGRSSKA